ncbi:unnamed protein product [Brachionus calyciflorus]|uniref:PDZ domain-containing protein n=1 Tax=Brachionus calyciflorus TaxID=104777 RepID=A0A813SIE5_9BILA|nr:unnamed protein product [Brachionus calyciflorus]
MYTKSTSSLGLLSAKPSSSSSSKPSNSAFRNNHPNRPQNSRLSTSNSELVSDLPDLSHLSEDERKIIEAVLERQKAEEERDLSLVRLLPAKSNTNQNFSTITNSNNSITNTISNQGGLKSKNIAQRHSISDIAQEIKQRYGSIDTGNVCDLCKKTKFTSSGVNRVCFNCKCRCCIRCSVKYTTKTKQIWMCIGCKKKQDEFFKSPILNKKNFVSDYILNKNQIKNTQNETGQINQPIPLKRQLPNISTIKQLSQDETSLKTEQQHQPNTTVTSSTTNSINPDNSDSNSIKKSTRLKMTLIKQASLNNPPSYFNDFDDHSEFNYLKNEPLNTSKHASSQELRKNSLNNNDYFYSSPGSSTSHINQNHFIRSRSKAERIQDPSQMYKASKNSSRKSSISNLNEASQYEIDEKTMYEREKSLNILLREKLKNRIETSSESNAINNQSIIEKEQGVKPNETVNSFEEIQTKLDELNKSPNPIRNNSSKKRPTRQKPSLPALPVNTNPTLIKNKLLAELCKKQNSFNLSDEDNQSNDSELVKIGHSVNNDSEDNEEDEVDDEEEEEEENEDYDLDDEIVSVTEYNTNDEMDLESASLAANNQINNLINNRRVSLLGARPSSIDDYLEQNLKKEEILAHKINRFLSPSDWKLSVDGKKMIGHVLLKKNMIPGNNSVVHSSSSSTIDSATDFNLSLSFGMKVTGGRVNPLTNQLSAYIVKVKKDSIADTIGRLQVEDEIVKWNGKLLRGLSFDEVYSIINKSKQDSQIELIVERILNLSRDKNGNYQEIESNLSLKNG